MSKDGELLFEKSAVKERWVQYIHDLYKDEKRGIRPDYVGDDGPSITQDEVSEALFCHGIHGQMLFHSR